MSPRKPASADTQRWQQVGALAGAVLLAVAGGTLTVTNSAGNSAAAVEARVDELRHRISALEVKVDALLARPR